jgi:molybdopterin synthase catalytic subunit
MPMMELEIRLFATLKDRVGKATISVTLSEPSTVQDLLAEVVGEYPELAPSISSLLVAVNRAYADEDTSLNPGDEIAFFPPVSGGAKADNPHPTYFVVTTEKVFLDKIHERIRRPDIGAIVTFSGSVRGQTDREGLPPSTLHLEYEAYREMAESKMVQIAGEIWDKWPQVKGIAIVQRIGKLDIGEATTIVACAASHRDQGAFEAARYGIDRLKEIVPVWKKEVGYDESIWIEGDYRPTSADN